MPSLWLFFILLFCLNLSLVNGVGEERACEILNVTVSQRWIGDSLSVTPESKAIQTNLESMVDLTKVSDDHWSCFETEATSGVLGTPGGDTSEFLLALAILFQDSPLLTYNGSLPSLNLTNNTSPLPSFSLSNYSSSSSMSPSPSPSNQLSDFPSAWYNDTYSQLLNATVLATLNGSDISSVNSSLESQTNGSSPLFPFVSSLLQQASNISSENSSSLDSQTTESSPLFPLLSSIVNMLPGLNSSDDSNSSSLNSQPSSDYNMSSFSGNYSELYNSSSSSSSDYNMSSFSGSYSGLYNSSSSSDYNMSSFPSNYSELYTSSSYGFNSTVNLTQSVTMTGNVSTAPPLPTNLSAILNPLLFNRIHEIFDEFMKTNITYSRRFYYHSDFDIVERLRTNFGLRNTDIFYDILTPEQQAQAFSLVIKPENIGCRHLLQILQNPTVYRTPIILTQTFLQVLHNYLWNHNNGTYYSKFYVDIPKRTHPVEIAHLNVSINIVSHPELDSPYDQTETTANPCLRVQPTIPTVIGNESYFVVQHKGISSLRRQLAEYTASLPEAKLSQEQTYKQIEELAGIQWGLSQSNLGPNLKSFDVVVYTQNRTGEVVQRTWLFVGIGVIAAALIAYLGYLYWKKRSEAAQDRLRLFDEEAPSSEKYPIRVDNVSYSAPKN